MQFSGKPLEPRDCAACLLRVGFTSAEAAQRAGVSKTAAQRAARRFADVQTRIPDTRLYCADCLFRIGCGMNLAVRLTGVAKATVKRYRDRRGYGRSTRPQVNLGKSPRDPEREWMERAWATEWRGIQYIGELRHWSQHPAISGYWRDVERSRTKGAERARLQHARAMAATDKPNWFIAKRLRSRVYKTIQRDGGRKTCATLALIGCSVSDLKRWLEALFEPGMSWANYGEWEIDHFMPCASFDLRDPSQQRECFNFRNLQPLWRRHNRAKWAYAPGRGGKEELLRPFRRAGSASRQVFRMST